MKSFEEIKEYTTTNAKRLQACSSEYSRALHAKTIDELLQVVKDNIVWCSNNKLFNYENIEEYFGIEKLNEFGIYVSQRQALKKIETGTVELIFLGSSTANVESWGSSTANVKSLDSSTANVESWDSSTANVKSWGSSTANVESWGSSTANVKSLDSSTANVKSWGNTQIKYELKSGYGLATIRDLSNKKLIVYKSAFEIIEI